jgi:DivIVA domain-containing protein
LALDRLQIEKKDFPIGRRGYEPEAVDAHLAQIAEEVSELKVSSRRRTETLASSAGEQVRAIVEAAESSAAEIQRQAEADASEIRAEATEDARATRAEANAQAQGYVGRVSESTAAMLKRIAAMESELGALLEALKTGSNRLSADLHLLEAGFDEVKAAAVPPAVAPAAATPAAVAPDDEFEEIGSVDEVEVAVFEEDEFEEFVVEEPAAAAEPVAEGSDSGAGADESEGARLVALNMALNGTPRDETDSYLAENFTLTDRAALLDEVYASLEG